MWWQKIILILYTCYIPVKCYKLKCPSEANWINRAKWVCKEKQRYHCLFDANFNIFREVCLRKDYVPEGLKSIFSGSRDATKCSEERFSPTISWTNEGYECKYQKSRCTEEGQIICNTGSSKEDATCRCDHITGYSFVTEPKHKYFCSPQKEDCSCFRKICQYGYILTADYICERGESSVVEPGCPAIFVPPRNEHDLEHVEVDDIVDFSTTSRKNFYRLILIVAVPVLLATILTASRCIIYERHHQLPVLSKSVLETSVFPKLQRVLDKRSLLILKGRKGTGKSTIGKVFQEMYSGDGYEIKHVVKSDNEILNMPEIASTKCFIFIDGICHPSNGTELFKGLIRILASSTNRKIKILVTMEYLYPQLDDIFLDSGHFLNLSEIMFDLDEKTFFSIEDRKKILRLHMTENNVYLNKPLEKRPKPMKECCVISEEVFNGILKEEPFIGFPWMCAAFCRHEDHIKLGLQYFKQPPAVLVASINKLRNKGYTEKYKAYQYCLLVSVLLWDTNLLDIEMLGKCQFPAIMKDLYNLEDISLKHTLMRQLMNELSPFYFAENESILTFSDLVVRHAVMISHYNVRPKDVLKKCYIPDVITFLRPKEYLPLHEEAILIVEVADTSTFAKHVAANILDNNKTTKEIIEKIDYFTERYGKTNFLLQVVRHLKNAQPDNYKARTEFFSSLGHFIRESIQSEKDAIYVYNLSWEFVSARLKENESYLDSIIQVIQNSDFRSEVLCTVLDKFENNLLHYLIIWNGKRDCEIVSKFIEKNGKKNKSEDDKLFTSENSNKYSPLQLAAFLGRDRFVSILYSPTMENRKSGKPTNKVKELKSLVEEGKKCANKEINRIKLKMSPELCSISHNAAIRFGGTESFEKITAFLKNKQ